MVTKSYGDRIRERENAEDEKEIEEWKREKMRKRTIKRWYEDGLTRTQLPKFKLY
jgi:hypothetical protein